jgi:hypothetical protein
MRIGIPALAMLMSPLVFNSAGALERTRLGLDEQDESSLSTGLEYERGDYGTPDSTDVWRIPIDYTWRHGDFSLFAELPLLYANSDGQIVVGNKTSHRRGGPMTGPMSGSTTTSTGESASGIGDIRLAGTYRFPADYRRDLVYRVTGIVKFGTASSSDGLGTGEDDFALEGGAVKHLDEYILSATFGYEFNGDSNTYDYNDVLYGSVGGTKWLSGNRQAGMTLSASEAVTPGGDEPVAITGFYRQPVSGRARYLSFYASKGLTDGSPDIMLGLQVLFSL